MFEAKQSDLFSVANKTVVITGGTSGIGEMLSRGFAAAGAKVFVVGRDPDRAHGLADDLRSRGADCAAFTFDLSTTPAIAAFVDELSRQTSSLDILINNAGATWGAPLDDFPESGWDRTLDLNLKSPFFLAQRLLPLLRNADPPARIINIASADGLNPPTFDSYGYAASKAGLIMLTRHLAKRLAPENILVNAIAPGPFQSRMMAKMLTDSGDKIRQNVPLNRLGSAEDIVGVAIFLASRASEYLSGATIPCDGGLSTL